MDSYLDVFENIPKFAYPITGANCVFGPAGYSSSNTKFYVLSDSELQPTSELFSIAIDKYSLNTWCQLKGHIHLNFYLSDSDLFKYL